MTSSGPQESRPSGLPIRTICPRCKGYRLIQPDDKRIAYGNERLPDVVGCPMCNPPAAIGQGRTFDLFEPVAGTEAMVAAAQMFARGDGAPGLTFVGKNGCGKTFIMEAIANAMRATGRRPTYVFVPDFLAHLRSTFEPESDWRFSDLWSRWADVDILLLDDLKHDSRPTPWAVEQMERIVETRYRKRKPYVVSTNGTLAAIAQVWGSRLADRLFDDRSGTVQVVYNTAVSYRTGKAWG